MATKAREVHFGVDFGTATTKVSLRQEGIPVPLAIGLEVGSEYQFPTVVHVDDHGRIVVGEEAAGHPDPSGRIEFLKRYMQHRPEDEGFNPIMGEEVRLANGATKAVPDLVKAVLGEALRRAFVAAEASHGVDLSAGAVVDVNVGCPLEGVVPQAVELG